jgi:hypothetical protein
MGGFTVVIYLIITIEQMVRRNGDEVSAGLSKWSFGQTLAIITLLQQVVDIIAWMEEGLDLEIEEDR